jgi:DNA-binding transcriptional ArsR family regulator
VFISAETTNLNVKARLFRGFSDPSRLKIMEALRAGELTVSSIIEQTGLSQSNVSNHLSCPVAGWSLSPAGTFAYYSAATAGGSCSCWPVTARRSRTGVYECTRYALPAERSDG